MKLEKQIPLADPPAPAHASPHAAAHPAYRPDIDGLRAVAVLSVLLFHAFPAWLRGGFIGVDVFFVISGFLITGILLRELEQGSFSFAGFYARRIRRIFPALLLVLAACLAFGWMALFPDEYQQLGKHVVGGASFAANFFYWAQVGYFDTAAETKPLLHLWSLGIEEQFYILWPVFLLLAWRRRIDPLLVAAGLGLASFALNLGGIGHDASATFYSPASRAWELLLGAGLACLQAKRAGRPAAAPRLPAWTPALLSWSGALLLAAGLALVTRHDPFPGWRALLPAGGALLLIAAGPQAWLNRHVLANRLLVWIGLLSYPLYLWHWPLLSFAQIVESREPAPAIRAGALLAALLLAWLTWRVLERPLRAAATRAEARARVAVLALLMLGMAAFGGYLYLNDGLPTRKPIEDSVANQKALVLVEDRANAEACKKRYGFDSMYEYCLLGDPAKDPTVALVGDSHAYHVVAGLTRYYGGIGENLLMLGTRHPYWGLDPQGDPYQQATQQMLELALATPSVKTVVFSTHLRFYTVPEQKVYVDAARETFRRLLAAGKQVVFMHDVPLLGFDPRSCIKRAGVASSATRVPCAIPRAEWDAQMAQHREIAARLAAEFPQIAWFDAGKVLCDKDQCHAMVDGRLMYRDNNHLSYEGDLLVGQRFAEWMRSRQP
ncbi:acyltransferase [Massilia oculi]|uniref:Acyltransferase n=1 Tax=Massilia hydrophila TaxID=3044279 RepID=A0ABS7YDW8_9BURK|nr:acyltransferase family protein [Massilia oculi]MCA1857910.1 acyltransferase [Massilia oculi]